MSQQIENVDVRPWGRFVILEEAEGHKVKRIEVEPGGRLSYQRHEKRHERWVIVKGLARVTLDGDVFDSHPGDTVHIPLGAAHRVENPGTELLVFVEVQTGTYFGEDDIERLEDDYGRV